LVLVLVLSEVWKQLKKILLTSFELVFWLCQFGLETSVDLT